MTKNLLVALFALIVVLGLGAYLYARIGEPAEPLPGTEQPGTENEGSRGMSIEEYVRANISELSPEPAVLGGAFYVTRIEAEGGTGVVEYEDGHIALVADFMYETEPEHGGITITSFTVREEERAE